MNYQTKGYVYIDEIDCTLKVHISLDYITMHNIMGELRMTQ